MAAQTTDTVIDITRRFEWEITKEKFEGCEDRHSFFTPNFIVNIESQLSKWELFIKLVPEDKIPTGQNLKVNGTGVLLGLALLPGDASLKVEVEGMGIKTERGYRPGMPCKPNTKTKMISKIEDFNGRNPREERVCGVYAGPREDILKLFNRNKITVVSTLRFYLDRSDYIKKNKREQTFVTHIRSISDLDTLADFTVICEGREFMCHRNILASRSTVFKGMILNGQFVEGRQNSVTIENASPDMVESMLDFISNGAVPDDIEEKAIDLIYLADRYDLQDLMDICESCLVDNLTVESVIETLIAIDLHVPNSKHRQKILDFIKKKASRVVKSNHWNKFVVKYPALVTEIVLSLAPVEDIDN